MLRNMYAGRTPIILTARTSHVELLAEMLKQHVANIIQLTGEGTAKNKRETLQKLQDIPKDAPLVIVATGKYVGEGFDYPRLDTLFLALPISWKGLVAQYAGRLHRENEGKKDVRIYDYIDIHEPVCENMYRKRLKGYSAIGYRVLSKDTQTLFDNTDDLQTSSYEGQIFNGNTFRLAFMQNLKSSRQSIVISSPKLYRTERNTFVKMLREFHVSGVQIAILTSEESSQTNYLKSLGLYVKIVPKLSLSSCIIDRSTVWYGSINILGYVTEEDNMASLYLDLQKLNEQGYKYIFIDEITKAEQFVRVSSLLSDEFAISGVHIVLTGTDSLGIYLSQKGELFDRAISIHTTYIPYYEYTHLFPNATAEDYIVEGGLLSKSGINYNRDENFKEYVDSAIAENIQHSLSKLKDKGDLGALFNS